MKKAKAVFWITTWLIVIMEGLVPVLTIHQPITIQGFTGLGYPVYFITLLTTFKALGAIALIVKKVPARVKEWAYAGFMFDFISAFVSIVAVMGFVAEAAAPIVAIIILILSYRSYHKMVRA